MDIVAKSVAFPQIQPMPLQGNHGGMYLFTSFRGKNVEGIEHDGVIQEPLRWVPGNCVPPN